MHSVQKDTQSLKIYDRPNLVVHSCNGRKSLFAKVKRSMFLYNHWKINEKVAIERDMRSWKVGMAVESTFTDIYVGPWTLHISLG